MKSKKTIAVLLLVIILLIGAIAGGTAWYLGEKAKPRQLVEEFLTSLQQTDLESMKNMVQSSDFSVLNDADIENPAFQEFFRQMNSQMTYSISKVRFNLQEGAAQVTAHIRYVDGTEIYRQTISDFLKDVVSTSFRSTGTSSEETQQKLSEMLLANAEKLSTTFTETDVLYPLVNARGAWKIASLDEETIRIMSANFVSIQSELQRTMDGESSEGGEIVNAVQEGSETSGSLDMTTDSFSLQYTGFHLQQDYAGNPCLLLFYNYTNNSDTASSALVDVHLEVYQHGKPMSAAIPVSSVPEIDNYMKEVAPGETLNVCQAFELTDNTSNVTVQADEAFTLGGSNVHSQIIALQ